MIKLNSRPIWLFLSCQFSKQNKLEMHRSFWLFSRYFYSLGCQFCSVGGHLRAVNRAKVRGITWIETISAGKNVPPCVADTRYSSLPPDTLLFEWEWCHHALLCWVQLHHPASSCIWKSSVMALLQACSAILRCLKKDVAASCVSVDACHGFHLKEGIVVV